MSNLPINMPPPHGDPKLKCGSCKWFKVGFEGKTCKVTRMVEMSTGACVEFQKAYAPIFDILAQDKYLSEMLLSIKVFKQEFILKMEAELKSYRLFPVKTQDPLDYACEENMKYITHKFETCIAYMERVYDIQITIGDKMTELQTLAKDTQAYLFDQYNEHMRSCKNDSERGAFFRVAVPELFKTIDKMENLVDKGKSTYALLLSAHYALCRMQEGSHKLSDLRLTSMSSNKRSSG